MLSFKTARDYGINKDVLFDLEVEDLKQLGVTALGDIKTVNKMEEAPQISV